MKRNFLTSPIRIILVFLTFSMIVLNTTGCNTALNDDKSPPLPTNNPTPEFLFDISPTGMMDQNSYNKSRFTKMVLARGIAVSIWTKRMGVAEENRKWEVIKQRVTLYIDGKKVPDETLLGGADGEKGGGLFRISWAPSLEPGLHTARFVFVNDSGQALEYTWQFTIIEE
jgi:hypothetical protein